MGERICRCQTKLETENKLTLLLCMPSTRYYTHNADLTAHNSNFLKQPSPNHKALGFYPTSISLALVRDTFCFLLSENEEECLQFLCARISGRMVSCQLLGPMQQLS